MKLVSFLIISTVFSVQAMAKAKKEVIHDRANIQVMLHLRCVTEAGLDSINRTYTELAQQKANDRSQPLPILRHPKLTVNHVVATADGCSVKTINKIAERARENYGFRIQIPITITKELGESFDNGIDGCFANYSETVVIELDEVTFTSEAGYLRKINDCK